MELLDVPGQLKAVTPEYSNDAKANGTVRFVLDGEIVELQNVDPTRTVLQFLREDLRRTGTKEGCAEGDCGACTVAVAELDSSGDGISLKTVNSCIQFLPTLDGKELITVESLDQGGTGLHPAQQAMVDHHGSQCGFCTPGFVMSLFALYKTQSDPSRRDIDDALAGNLCRCTGYRPIVAAAGAMYGAPAADDDWLRQPHGSTQTVADRAERLRKIARDNSLELRHGKRIFFAPRTIDELASLLDQHPEAKILAGGTDIGLWVTKQHRELDSVVYVGEVEGLADISESDSHIEIGGAATFSDAMPAILEHYPLLDEMLRRFASPPIRNSGTLGGNVANGSPIGDSMPALMAAGASIVIRSAAGSRELALDDFYHGYQVNDLRPGEFIERIRLPVPGPDTRLYCYKLSKRFDQDISALCVACRLELEGDRVRSIRIACGGLAATVKRATQTEQAMAGKSWTEDTLAAGMAAFASDFEPITDMRASAAYRLRCGQNLLRRLYLESRGELTESVYLYGRHG
jgi:xanthine dehydrogenase small subunit